jgi:thioredoxin-dependent peroxiredoxin
MHWRPTVADTASSSSVKAGDPAPEITLPDQDGQQVSLSSYRGRWVVVYFYPADDTPGCTKESCSFRDAYQDFTDAGAEVIGVSGDSVASHKKFAEKHRLPFRLLADEGDVVRKRYGAMGRAGVLGMKGRITYVVDPEGTVQKVFNSQLQFNRHQKEALATIRGG